MPRDNRLYSGFVLHDYVLTFQVRDDARRAQLIELCRGPWQGDEVNPTTWEVSNTLSPDQMENTLLDLIDEGDRVVYYYLSDSKRMFRVVLE
ncbi:MAG: hypothetical protein IPK82_34725 [Polyangiaceae bacterium]|nr:hypothetical protein [Polyangiaceae bacterium]